MRTSTPTISASRGWNSFRGDSGEYESPRDSGTEGLAQSLPISSRLKIGMADRWPTIRVSAWPPSSMRTGHGYRRLSTRPGPSASCARGPTGRQFLLESAVSNFANPVNYRLNPQTPCARSFVSTSTPLNGSARLAHRIGTDEFDSAAIEECCLVAD